MVPSKLKYKSISSVDLYVVYKLSGGVGANHTMLHASYGYYYRAGRMWKVHLFVENKWDIGLFLNMMKKLLVKYDQI